MKFSIITPCKTRDIKKLKTLQVSIEQQHYLDIEWIIAYEADPKVPFSKLTSESIQIKTISIPQSTPGSALYKAVSLSSGEYLVFVDADDLLFPNCLSQLSNLLNSNEFNIVDLSNYPTYEPAKTIFGELQKNKYYLPKWGGEKTEKNDLDKPPFSTLDFEDSKKQALPKFSSYRKNKRLHVFTEQLNLTGKVIRNTLFPRNKLLYGLTNPIFYSDMLMVTIGQKINTYTKLIFPSYIKIRHNDPINDPSLTQTESSQMWFYMISNWLETLPYLSNKIWKTKYIHQCVDYINIYLCSALAKPENMGTQINSILDLLRTWLSITGQEAQETAKLTTRWLLRPIAKKEDKKAIHRSKIIKFLRQINRLRQSDHRSLKSVSKLCYQYIFTKLPIKQNVILYESFLGRNISDSPKYIYQFLKENYPGKFKHVWVINPEFTNFPANNSNTVFVKRFGFRYMYYLAVSKYQVINMRQPKWFQKRENTTLLSTWHGTPLKHLVFDMDNVASANPLYKEVFYHQSRQWDFLISPNQYSSNIFEHAFMYPQKQMLPSGYPRNDILNAPNKVEKAKRIKSKLGIPQDKKVILYAPTWRDDDYFEVGKYKFTLKLDIGKLRNKLSDDFVLVLRTHYFIANHLDTSEFGDFVFNESSYDDIAELYLISDVLITDYSSVFFDYAILKRPILFYVYDYEQYADVLRGFYLNMSKDLPGPLLKTSDDVLDALEHLDSIQNKYADRYHLFSSRFNAWEDGHATERVVNKVFSEALKDISK
ncbi:bifunctional glycosyltransferase family 2 protein/CDP-glycerol:glycerophosphate glycerophosphotransferase [Pediococcus ethanolidurans]|uniref:bifunctional glycosyltransferase family 2 protein/CDP-glycerol:glycerophosphate glycerophosphotransferase n=1 Tax=Pediococcus ethanolidurans TaxID=319653 RepID=UPI0021E83AEC|nr:bifunctional glycosyltransferase family 2 protein/CDP-glycerol:glycerophosphate glycerophosphotransferase [Pediococcus ethanolidurans]MCV3322526.1 bifunctional glycosyltransferase family 2 protein/CDP-glycerol:glycerophosphate glycerophosphotransferase [Pediococcus ethanolidurans]